MRMIETVDLGTDDVYINDVWLNKCRCIPLFDDTVFF